MDWLQLLINLVATGILLFVFQKVIDERSAKRLEKFKAELQSISFQGETKFLKLHETRVQVIAELHKKQTLILNRLFSLKHILESKETNSFSEQFQEVNTMLGDFKSYLDANKLCLPENLLVKLGKFYRKSLQTESGFYISFLDKDFALDNGEAKASYIEKHRQSLLRASSDLNEKIVPLTKEIETEFRNLIGS